MTRNERTFCRGTARATSIECRPSIPPRKAGNRPVRHIAPTALLQLQGYDWPGNVLERVIVTATRKIIDVQGLTLADVVTPDVSPQSVRCQSVVPFRAVTS